MINDNIIDFTNNSSGGGGTSFTTAMLSYPTGTSASSDSILYNYIKGMYDNGTSIVALNTYWAVEGSLTITDYGIASGFSSSNYVKLSEIDLTQANSWELEIGGVTPSDATNEGEMLGFTDAYWGQPGHDNILIGFYDDNGTPSLWVNTTNSNELSYPYPVSTPFKIKMEFTGTTYNFYIDTGSGYVEVYSNEDSTKIQSKFDYCILGTVKNDTTRVWNSTIDLSSFKLKIDGKYLYYGYAIPCKTVSSGSRVVDVTNKALVDTFAQEIGFAPFYIIDTTNKTVQLPQGDIFGFISTLFFTK